MVCNNLLEVTVFKVLRRKHLDSWLGRIRNSDLRNVTNTPTPIRTLKLCILTQFLSSKYNYCNSWEKPRSVTDTVAGSSAVGDECCRVKTQPENGSNSWAYEPPEGLGITGCEPATLNFEAFDLLSQ